MNNTSLSVARPGGGQLARAVDLGEQREIVRANFCAGASDAEMDWLFGAAKQLDANPLTREIHLAAYTDRNGNRKAFLQVGIDWLRRKALQSGNVVAIYGPHLAGPDGVFYGPDLEGVPDCIPDGTPIYAARCGIKLRTIENVQWFTSYWDEFGSNRDVWAQKPRHMLKKVAMSHALKWGAIDVAGVYTEEELDSMEMEQAISVVADDKPPRPAPPPRPERVTVEEEPGAKNVDVDQNKNPEEEQCEALIELVKNELGPVCFPNPEEKYGIDWDPFKEHVKPLAWCGKWSRKYPQLKEWSLDQLKALVAELRRGISGGDVVSEPEEPAEEVAGEVVDDDPAEVVESEEASQVSDDDFGTEDDA